MIDKGVALSECFMRCEKAHGEGRFILTSNARNTSNPLQDVINLAMSSNLQVKARSLFSCFLLNYNHGNDDLGDPGNHSVIRFLFVVPCSSSSSSNRYRRLNPA